MWKWPLVALLVAQLTPTPACAPDEPAPSPSPSPAPSPAPAPAPAPDPDTFTTSDGVRFRVETVARDLEVPWAMSFAPDGRLFVTERPGRVRIFDAALATSAVALSMN